MFRYGVYFAAMYFPGGERKGKVSRNVSVTKRHVALAARYHNSPFVAELS